MTPTELKINEISKAYKNRKVVDRVSFNIKSGQVVGLLGPNGAGKTTSFYIAVGLIHADPGEVLLGGQSIAGKPMHERARLGLAYLPQEASVFRRLTVADNILVSLEAQGLQGPERAERLQTLLSDFKIEHISESYGYALSGGERRRVELARALAMEPKFLLLDEPFAGIDPIAVHDIQNLIKYLRDQGIGVLITDHNVRETLKICDQAYILKDGRIQVCGTAQEIADSKLARQFYLGENFQL